MTKQLADVLRKKAKQIEASPPKRFKRCIVHIGTEKTGTSAIQHFLGKNHKPLLKAGVFYPRTVGLNHGSQWEFVAAVYDKAGDSNLDHIFDITTLDDRGVHLSKLINTLEAEFARCPRADTLVISSEHFHSRVNTPDLIGELKELLDPWVESYEITVYFRRQDRVALSLNSTRLKSGALRDDFGFPSGNPSTLRYYNYEFVFDQWAAVFGRDSMKVRLYPIENLNSKSLIADFCQTCELPIEGMFMPAHVNRSLNLKGFHFLHAVNQQLPTKIDGKINPERAALVQEISLLYPGKHYLVTRKQAETFYNQFRESNENLRKKIFPNRSAPLFDEDFSEYPESLEDNQPDYGEAVSIALDLWRRPPMHKARKTVMDILLAKWKNITQGF